MKYSHRIVFRDKEKRHIKITQEQYDRVKQIISSSKFIEVDENICAVSEIAFIEKMKEYFDRLEAPRRKPLSRSFLQNQRKKFAKKWSW